MHAVVERAARRGARQRGRHRCGHARGCDRAAAAGGARSREVSSDAALPFAAASAVLHVAYLALLARAYSGGEVSIVYPVSRGHRPGAGARRSAPSRWARTRPALAGGRRARGLRRGVPRERPRGEFARRDLLFGLAIALTIAAYTLVDAARCGPRPAGRLPGAAAHAVGAVYAAALLIARTGPADARRAEPAGARHRGAAWWAPTAWCSPRCGWPTPRRWPRCASRAS